MKRTSLPSEGKAYIIATTPRCGSHHFSGLLWKTGLCGHPSEYVRPQDELIWREILGCPSFDDYKKFYLARAWTTNGVFGVKLMWEQFIRLTQDLSGEQNLNTCAMAAIMAAPFSTCKYVFLTRGDRVRQAISYYRALKTGRWNRTEATVAAAGETYDPTAIGALATEIDRLNAQWRQFFSETGVEHLELIYESFIASPETHLRQVFDFVGVTAPASRKWPASSGLLPQSDSTTEEWVARYRSEQQC